MKVHKIRYLTSIESNNPILNYYFSSDYIWFPCYKFSFVLVNEKKVWKKSFSKKEFFSIYLMLLFCRIIDGKVECDAQSLMVELESRFYE